MVIRWSWKTLSSVRKTSSKLYSAQSLEKIFLFCFCTSLSSGTIFGNFCTYPDENKYFATVVRCAVFPVSWATICESFEDDESGLLRANSQIFCLSESENILGRPDPTFRPSLSPFSSFFMFRWNVLGAILDKFRKVFRSWVNSLKHNSRISRCFCMFSRNREQTLRVLLLSSYTRENKCYMFWKRSSMSIYCVNIKNIRRFKDSQ